MIEKLRSKLRENRKSIKWFVDKYMPDFKYSRISAQINGFNDLQEETIKAIENYLKEA